jgi:hypothetical protein
MNMDRKLNYKVQMFINHSDPNTQPGDKISQVLASCTDPNDLPFLPVVEGDFRMWLLNNHLYLNQSQHIQEKFQSFLNEYASKKTKAGENREYIPPRFSNDNETNYGIEFPGYHIENMLDVVIDHLNAKQDYHRFLIIELRNKKREFSLNFSQKDDIASGYCPYCHK